MVSVYNYSELYPLTINRVLKYCVHLGHKECGPSVLPAFKISLKWVASRLAIDLMIGDFGRFRRQWWSIVPRL